MTQHFTEKENAWKGMIMPLIQIRLRCMSTQGLNLPLCRCDWEIGKFIRCTYKFVDIIPEIIDPPTPIPEGKRNTFSSTSDSIILRCPLLKPLLDLSNQNRKKGKNSTFGSNLST